MKLQPEERAVLNAAIEERWAARAMVSAEALAARHVVLLASPSEGAEQETLAWLEQFSRRASLRLRLSFYPDTADMAAGSSKAMDTASDILQEAAQPDVELVVVSGLPIERGAAWQRLACTLLRRCQRPLLFLAPTPAQPLVMAATDCSDPSLPVLRAAWQMAAALGSQIVLVHNIDERASQLAERIGMPLSPELADVLALRSQEWLQNAAAIHDVVITRDGDNATGVLAAAQRMDVGLLVVGVKPADQAPHGTAEQILLKTQRSALFVPLARAAATPPTPAPPTPAPPTN